MVDFDTTIAHTWRIRKPVGPLVNLPEVASNYCDGLWSNSLLLLSKLHPCKILAETSYYSSDFPRVEPIEIEWSFPVFLPYSEIQISLDLSSAVPIPAALGRLEWEDLPATKKKTKALLEHLREKLQFSEFQFGKKDRKNYLEQAIRRWAKTIVSVALLRRTLKSLIKRRFTPPIYKGGKRELVCLVNVDRRAWTGRLGNELELFLRRIRADVPIIRYWYFQPVPFVPSESPELASSSVSIMRKLVHIDVRPVRMKNWFRNHQYRPWMRDDRSKFGFSMEAYRHPRSDLGDDIASIDQRIGFRPGHAPRKVCDYGFEEKEAA